MQIEIDWFTLLVVFPLFVIGLFFLVYWAVRWANLDTPSLPRFSAYVEQDGQTTRLKLANIGMGPAFDLTIHWAGDARPFGQTRVLMPQAIFTCELPRDMAGHGLPGESTGGQAVVWLSIMFRPDAAASGRSTRVPLDLPDGLPEPRVEPRPTEG
jgi:hypothetical protein